MLRRTVYTAVGFVLTVLAHAQLTLLDPSFGTGGMVQLDVSGLGGDLADDVVIMPDGRILVSGMRNGTTEAMIALRLMENGTLDTGFGQAGVATVNFGGDSEARAIALQSDGSIVLGGNAEYPGVFDDLAFARLTPNGQLDPTFSGDGKRVFTGPGASDAIRTLSIAPDGRIVGSGNYEGTQPDMVAVVLTADGEPDAAFAADGIFATTDHTGELAQTHVLRSDGRLVLCGALRMIYPDADMAMLQLAADGSPDPGFGVDGLFRPEEAGSVSMVAAAIGLEDGRILIAGRRFLPGSGLEEVFTGRVTADGAWDLGYGSGGRSFLGLGQGNTGYVRDMVLLPDGKALVAVDVLADSVPGVMALRVLPDGGLDETFGNAGRVLMPCPGDGCGARALALDAQGRVVMAGTYSTASGTHILLMRWLAEASSVGQSALGGVRPFTVYPVPTSGEVRLVRTSVGASPQGAALVDATGRTTHVFHQGELRNEVLMIPASVAEGTYVLRLITADGTVGVPVILRR